MLSDEELACPFADCLMSFLMRNLSEIDGDDSIIFPSKTEKSGFITIKDIKNRHENVAYLVYRNALMNNQAAPAPTTTGMIMS